MSEVEQVQFTGDEAENFANAERTPEPEKNPSRPDWLQDKFQTPQDLAKAYDELERKLGGKKPDAPREATETAQNEGLHQAREEIDQRLESPPSTGDTPMLPGLENNVIEEISDYAWQNQSLSEEHYATLEAAGYSRDMVNSFMEGQFARAEDGHNMLMEAGGGEQNVEQMFMWAQQNLSEQQIAAYDEYFDRGGPDALMAMENLRAKYDQAGGSSAWTGVQGANAPSYEVGQFQSTADVMEAMADPRYKTNESYRQEVARKLARSNVLNNGRA